MQRKQAQSAIYSDLLSSDVMLAEDEKSEKEEIKDEPMAESVVFEISEPEPEALVFLLPTVPGAPDAAEIVIDDEDDNDLAVEEEKDVEVVTDPYDWQAGGLENYLSWLHNMMNNPPTHTGYDTTGLEKTIAYFTFLEKTIPKAMRMDIKNVIDSRKAEEAREQIYNALERLEERLEQVTAKKYRRNKKAWAETSGMVKEARSPGVTGITVTVPLIISICARTCINGMVSAGHDLEELYASQVEEYGLDKIQQAELAQLLSDMGLPIHRDRGFAPGTHVDTTRSDNRDWAANYQA